MLRNKFEHIHQCHRIPSHCTSPCMFRLSGHRVRPTLSAAYIARMTIKTIFRIIRMTGTSDKLVDYICIVLRKIITECILCVERSSHVNSVQPHLVGINLFMPKTTVLITRLSFKLAIKQVERFLIFRILGLLIDTEKDFSGVDTVKTVIG